MAITTLTGPQDPPLEYDAVAIGRVESQVSGGRPPDVTVTTSRPDIGATVIGTDFCLTATVQRSLPGPATIAITLSAPGFVPLTAVVTIDPTAIPVALGTFRLRPYPVRVQGRVVAADTGAGLPGARVLAIDNPGVSVPPPVHSLALNRPLARSHVASATLEQYTVTSAGASLGFAQPAALGDTEIMLRTRAGLSSGGVLGIGPTAAGDYVEYAEITDPGPAPLAAPGPVTLSTGLTLSFPAGASAALLTISATGTTSSLADAASSGEAVVVANDLMSGLLRIEPGPSEEYRSVGAVTDSGGYYRLDGIGHVVSLWLAAEAATPYHSAHQQLTVPFGTPVTVVDFKLSP